MVARMSKEEHARALPDLVLESAASPFIVAPRPMALALAATAAIDLVASSAAVVPTVAEWEPHWAHRLG